MRFKVLDRRYIAHGVCNPRPDAATIFRVDVRARHKKSRQFTLLRFKTHGRRFKSLGQRFRLTGVRFQSPDRRCRTRGWGDARTDCGQTRRVVMVIGSARLQGPNRIARRRHTFAGGGSVEVEASDSRDFLATADAVFEGIADPSRDRMVAPTVSQLVGQMANCSELRAWQSRTSEGPGRSQVAIKLPEYGLETARQTAFADNLIVLSPLLAETPFAGQAILNSGKSIHCVADELAPEWRKAARVPGVRP